MPVFSRATSAGHRLAFAVLMKSIREHPEAWQTFFKKLFVFYVYAYFVSMCVQCPGRPEEGVRFLELELHPVMSCIGNRAWHSWS